VAKDNLSTDVTSRHEYPKEQVNESCAHGPNACRSCIAKHEGTELDRGVLWKELTCVECQNLLDQKAISRMVWREDWER
jgi:hypothetical protein